MAVPSTTSMMMQPTIRGYFYLLVRVSVILHATDPPIEWPIMTTFLSWYLSMSCFSTYIVYETIVSIEKSSKFYVFLEYPCPLKSKATRVPKFLTYLAKVAKLKAEWPAP